MVERSAASVPVRLGAALEAKRGCTHQTGVKILDTALPPYAGGVPPYETGGVRELRVP